MGSQQTGLNPSNVNSALSTAKKQSDNVMDELRTGFNNLLDNLAENWGTKDGKTWVEGECTTEINNMLTKVSDTLSKIASVINQVAVAQLGDTSNTQEINAAQATKTVKAQTKNMKDHLGNGYVGIYEELKGDLQTKEGELITSFKEAMGKLQSQVIEKCDVAFNLVGASDKVSSECTMYINKAMFVITSGLNSLNADITAEVSSADTYVRDIQNAGLRGAVGSN